MIQRPPRAATTSEPHAAVRLMALAGEGAPWFRIEPLAALHPGRWVRLWYRLSLLHDPVRPLMKIRLRSGEERQAVLPGPVLGRASWLGCIPEDATEVLISPAVEPGPVPFAIERIEPVPLAAVLSQALRANRGRALSALGAVAIGWRPEAEENLRWALGRTPIEHWPAYSAERRVAPDPADFERPISDWSEGAQVHLVMEASEDRDALRQTVSSLLAQVYPHWTLTLTDWASSEPALEADPRIRASISPESCLREGGERDLVGVLSPGDRLEPYALAGVIEREAKRPEVQGFYGDEEVEAGGHAVPVFRPGWGLFLFHSTRDLGRLVLVRRRQLGEASVLLGAGRLHSAILDAFTRLGPGEAVHLRRILVRGAARDHAMPPRVVPKSKPVPDGPSVAVVMPTRDRPELLRRSTEGVLTRTAGRLELVIVDNGSQEPAACDILMELERDPRVTVLRQPGPFNYSGLCNAGAATTKADILVFLNNDVEVTEPDWLSHLISWAARPEIGAVGAKLLYPDGRLQHAGITIGIGGECGHFGAGGSGDAPGWQGRHLVPHEVLAVTGACLAVERRKFEAVGGFDAENLPIEFSDVDLCLKLMERGWQTIWTPEAVLVHFESASRGRATFRRLSHHGRERAYFLSRWERFLRDDPFFHPALSLYSLDEALA